MPRRRSDIQDDFNEQIALPPAPRVVGHTHKHGHEHVIDPYAVLPGAIPGKLSNLEVKTKPKKATQKDLAQRDAIRAETRAAAKRYNQYLDVLGETGGNKIAALARVYGLDAEEAEERFEELHLDVRRGIGSTEVGRILEQNDLDIHARARVLKKWMYSDEPGPSLKAVDMLSELADDTDTAGSFEVFLRLAKQAG